VALQNYFRGGVGFLQIHTPVAEFFERDCNAGNRATHERSRPDDTEITVEILDLSFAWGRKGSIGTIKQNQPPESRPCASSKIVALVAEENPGYRLDEL
jgi:hypothetical protein